MSESQETESLFPAFRFCPRCGTESLTLDSGKRFSCSTCSFVFFMNTAAACAAIVEDPDGRLLLTLRMKDPAKGKWDLPGGFIDNEETAEGALMRELNEELGLEEGEPEYLFSLPNRYDYKEVGYFTVDLFYRVRLKHPERLSAKDEIEELKFFEPSDVPWDDLSFVSVRKGLRRYLKS